jgi:hypothetical protein
MYIAGNRTRVRLPSSSQPNNYTHYTHWAIRTPHAEQLTLCKVEERCLLGLFTV